MSALEHRDFKRVKAGFGVVASHLGFLPQGSYIQGMSTMIAEVYEAFKEAGDFDYENRFAKIETDLTLLKWMVGLNLAVSLGIAMLLLR